MAEHLFLLFIMCASYSWGKNHREHVSYFNITGMSMNGKGGFAARVDCLENGSSIHLHGVPIIN